MSGCILHLSISHSHVFLLNSCLDLFSAPPSLEDPLSRSYRVNLPSSLTVTHSSALVFSTRPRVSVSVRVPNGLCLADFLGSLITPAIASRKRLADSQVRLSPWICLRGSTPTPFNRLFRQPAGLSLLRLHVAPSGSDGIFTVSSIGLAVRLCLRSRLTLIRLALIRKPWSFGGRVSRPPYRYSYLHLLFHALQQRSSSIFNAHGMLPYHPSRIHGFGTGFMPDYYPRRIARLVSCYALFK